jgi:hypothetical protein
MSDQSELSDTLSDAISRLLSYRDGLECERGDHLRAITELDERLTAATGRIRAAEAALAAYRGATGDAASPPAAPPPAAFQPVASEPDPADPADTVTAAARALADDEPGGGAPTTPAAPLPEVPEGFEARDPGAEWPGASGLVEVILRDGQRLTRDAEALFWAAYPEHPELEIIAWRKAPSADSFPTIKLSGVAHPTPPRSFAEMFLGGGGR